MDEQYRMILVDDEDEVRGRINSKITPESGFVVVGSAGNGYDAVELIEKTAPHIVLTDIKMPYIDGIELTRIIKRDYPTVKVAFITGYDEFEYAREAVDLHIVSYLTKPVSQEDITSFLIRLKQELDTEYEQKYDIEKLRSRYEQHIPMIIENFFSSYLITGRRYYDEGRDNLRSYGVTLDDTRYLLSYVKIEQEQHTDDVKQREERKVSVRTTMQSTLERYGYGHYSFLFLDGIVFIIKESGEEFMKKIDQVLYEMVKILQRFLSVSISIGVSRLHREFSSLQDAYHEAEIALGYSAFLNTGRIVYINQLQKDTTTVLSLAEHDIQRLEYAAKFGTDDDVRTHIDSLRRSTHSDQQIITNYRLYTINLVNVVVSFAESMKVDLQEVLNGDILEIISRFRHVDQLYDWVLSTILLLREQNEAARKDNSQRYIDAAAAYMQENYQDFTISMEQVCDDLGISISYLSLLFRKHMKTTFVKYLTSIRMEKAHELLRFTGDRIIEIAQSCGYRDVYYFSHSFKKYYGVSPRNYRETLDT
ncbi:MAG: response regulator [Spirochaetia bacterium]|nr:response regulator [Spirochaetia bacterium]